jgi:hypothetical protein
MSTCNCDEPDILTKGFATVPVKMLHDCYETERKLEGLKAMVTVGFEYLQAHPDVNYDTFHRVLVQAQTTARAAYVPPKIPTTREIYGIK